MQGVPEFHDTHEAPMPTSLLCRICNEPMTQTFVDLGMIPLCQQYVDADRLEDGEVFYPLHARACLACHYVGLPEYVRAEDIFSEYAYFSSYSSSWVDYVRDSVTHMVEAYRLDSRSQVVEMASNDGYLLRFLVERGIPALGVEPAANVARVANEQGLTTVADFFCLRTAEDLRARGHQADLLLSFNSLDHVPDLHDVAAGMRAILKPSGVIHIEVPYLRALVDGNEFDTVYHDRYSYLSLLAIHELFWRFGLRVFDAELIPTHGGSLRVLACHAGNHDRPTLSRVAALLAEERECGMSTPEYYSGFMHRVTRTKHDLLECLIRLKREGHSIVGYGVPAKGNVLLNYCGIRGDFIDYLVDRSPYKYGKYAPGSRLQIREVNAIRETRPSRILILPWNIKEEIVEQMAFVQEWGAHFLVAIPTVQELEPVPHPV